MANVWILEYLEEDMQEPEKVGVFRSLRKAQLKAKRHAGLPPRSRKMQWEQISERFMRATFTVVDTLQLIEGGETSKVTMTETYYLTRWIVQ